VTQEGKTFHAKSQASLKIKIPAALKKHKVPPTYSRADDSARSLNGHRDDE
jgi:hypothetical protein